MVLTVTAVIVGTFLSHLKLAKPSIFCQELFSYARMMEKVTLVLVTR